MYTIHLSVREKLCCAEKLKIIFISNNDLTCVADISNAVLAKFRQNYLIKRNNLNETSSRQIIPNQKENVIKHVLMKI